MAQELTVIGGGVIGLASACKMARSGWKVQLYEYHEIGSGASPVAAGMLAPTKEARQRDAFLDLCMASTGAYPAFVRQLEQETGVPINLRFDGMLLTALDEREVEEFKQWSRYLPHVQWMPEQHVHEFEPLLSPNVRAGLFIPTEGHLDTGSLMDALHRSAYINGVEIHEADPILRVVHDGHHVEAVETLEGIHPVEHVLVAAGVAANRIAGLDRDWMPQVRPVRGQILTLKTHGDPIGHIVHGAGIYLVPRKNGRLIVGATSEENSYRKEPDVAGVTFLLNHAEQLVPDVASYGLEAVHVGFRPAVQDLKPVLGPSPVQGLDLAVGHYRNGILLAPITADLLAEYLATGVVPKAMKPFLVNRFAHQGQTGTTPPPNESMRETSV